MLCDRSRLRPSASRSGSREELFDRLEAYAERDGISKSTVIKQAVREYLDRRGVDPESDR